MKFKRKKNVKFTAETLCLGLFTLFCVMAISCERYEPQKDDPPTKDSCNCIMDTLKGEWKWFETQGGIGGATHGIEFKCVIRMLSQNADASINYQVLVDDTLFSNGSFQLQHPQWAHGMIGVADIKLPHRNPTGDWGIDFDYLVDFINGAFRRTSPRIDTLIFNMPAADGYNYCYQKIK